MVKSKMTDKENLDEILENEEINNESSDNDVINKDIELNEFFLKHFPDFKEKMTGISQDNADKFQSWITDKMENGVEYLDKLKLETAEKLKSKYGDNYEDVKKNAFSLLPDDLEINPEKEFETIEKLYNVYKRLESKPPIQTKTVNQNIWDKNNPFLDSSHPDHKKVLLKYLSRIN
jgi:hypothetical protein